MKTSNLKDFIKGWFVGNFEPSLYKTECFEIACKTFLAGEYEPCHFHKIAEEFTLVVDGIIKMNNCEYKKDDIIHVEMNENIDFVSVTDSCIIVVKIPSAQNDKFLSN